MDIISTLHYLLPLTFIRRRTIWVVNRGCKQVMIDIVSISDTPPYKRRDHSLKTKLKEPVVVISQNAIVNLKTYTNGKKPIMGLSDYEINVGTI